MGCADGEREWFTNQTVHPLIAGCSGGFQQPGVKKQSSEVNHDVTCGNTGGDDGPFPAGEECSASDLCAEGWHLCSDAVEVEALSGTGDCDNAAHVQLAEDVFFATGQSTNGAQLCTSDGVNDIFGCGSGMELQDPEIIFGSALPKLQEWLDASDDVSGRSWKAKVGYHLSFSAGTGFAIDPDDGLIYADIRNARGSFPYVTLIPSSGTHSVFAVQ